MFDDLTYPEQLALAALLGDFANQVPPDLLAMLEAKGLVLHGVPVQGVYADAANFALERFGDLIPAEHQQRFHECIACSTGPCFGSPFRRPLEQLGLENGDSLIDCVKYG